MVMKRSIWIGYDPRETDAFAVARHSIEKHLTQPIPIRGLVLPRLRKAGLYWRPTSVKDGRLWDDISDAPMSTQFSNSRFLVPHLAGTGYAIFLDADMLVRENLCRLFEIAEADPTKALWCVKHDHVPSSMVKMDNQVQTTYGRKNWSSVCVWNCDAPSVQALTPAVVNSMTGRELHQFRYIPDDEIGALDPEWNHLVGEVPPNDKAKIVHMTLGVPSMRGYEDCEFADEWRSELEEWAS